MMYYPPNYGEPNGKEMEHEMNTGLQDDRRAASLHHDTQGLNLGHPTSKAAH